MRLAGPHSWYGRFEQDKKEDMLPRPGRQSHTDCAIAEKATSGQKAACRRSSKR